LLTSCSSNKSEKPLETGQTKGEPTKPITQEKSPDIKRIDEQAALINLLVSNPDDYCSTERRIKKLGSIATTDDGKKYASSKIVELFGIIEPKTKEIVALSRIVWVIEFQLTCYEVNHIHKISHISISSCSSFSKLNFVVYTFHDSRVDSRVDIIDYS